MTVTNFKYNDIDLTPLQMEHVTELAALAADPRIWQNYPIDLSQPEVFKPKWFEKALRQIAEGKRQCFVVRQAQALVGSTSYYDIDLENKCIAIGYTWFHPNCWGSCVNATAKLLMLQNAFENMAMQRVVFNVDQNNAQSQKALAKLGIKQDGLKDTRVVFAVTDEQWPELKNSLLLSLGADNK